MVISNNLGGKEKLGYNWKSLVPNIRYSFVNLHWSIGGKWESPRDSMEKKGITFLVLCSLRRKRCWLNGIVLIGSTTMITPYP
jgi:hypothetical protein